MPKILIISSDFNLVTIMEARLLMDGYEVFTAEDGFSGLQKVQGLKPHLIILDAALPKMPGHQLIEKIRAIPECGRVPVIVLADQIWVQDLYCGAGIFYFSPKPVLYTEFIKKVAEAVALAGAKKGPAPKGKAADSPAERGRILLAGAQEFILIKVQTFFVAQGFTVELCVDEAELLRRAEAVSPDYIFIQFWEDLRVFNAFKVEEALSKNPKLRALPLYVFCHQKLVNDVRGFIVYDHAIPFVESSELLAQLQKLLSHGKGRP